MKKLILIVFIMLAIILSTTAVIVTQTKQDEAAIEATESNVKEEIFNAHAIAIQFILKGYEEEVRLYTSQMENTNKDGKIAFLIEAEGVNSVTHNLFIIVVKNERAELIKQLI